MSRQQDNRVGLAKSLHQLGFLTMQQQDYQAAHQLFHESLTISRAIPMQRLATTTLFNLGQMAVVEKNYENARQFFRESLELYQQLGDEAGAMKVQRVLEWVDREQSKTASDKG